jgi:hypothetical protein
MAPNIVIISNTIATIFSNILTSESKNVSTITIQSGAPHPLMDLGPSCVNIQPYCAIQKL